MEQQLLNVNDIAKITGVHAQTIRNWEKAKLLHPLRLNGGQRVYTSEHLEVVKKIKMLRDQGMQNKAIKTALEGGIKVTNISDFKSKKSSSEKETVSAKKETPVKTASTNKKNAKAVTKPASQKKTTKKAAMSVEAPEKTKVKTTPPKASSKPSQRPTASTLVKKDSSAKKTPTSSKKDENKIATLIAKYEGMGIEDLQAEAKKQGVRQFRRMLKEELVLALADPSQREDIISKVRDRARERYGKHGSRIGATTVERVQSVVSTNPKKNTSVKKKETLTKKSTATAAVPSAPVIRSQKEEAIAYLKQEAASRQISLEDLVKELKASE